MISAKNKKGLNKALIKFISKDKNEPDWMLEHRLKSLEIFRELKAPQWGPVLANLDLAKITYYLKSTYEVKKRWEDVPDDIKQTFLDLGIPQAEAMSLAGAGAQYESTGVYHNLKEEISKQGVIFEDMDAAIQKYPKLVKKYFMKCVSPRLHKFAALHGAVWSGGTFLYIPKGVKIEQPIQAYFRMNTQGMGQFEHTLIVIEDEAQGHYIEGCSAPRYGVDSLHAGCVEIFAGKKARFRYSSVENWSKDIYNLNTKRAIVQAGSQIEWVSGNFGSRVSMLYPCSVLAGVGARSDHLGVSFAGAGQTQDIGAKNIHLASNTSSNVLALSISKDGGSSVYRGLVEIAKNASASAANVRCDAIMLDNLSNSKTIPKINIKNKNAQLTHEASAGKLSEEDIFYLRSRGIGEQDAIAMILNGFTSPITKELPLEYAVEMNRMIELAMRPNG